MERSMTARRRTSRLECTEHHGLMTTALVIMTTKPRTKISEESRELGEPTQAEEQPSCQLPDSIKIKATSVQQQRYKCAAAQKRVRSSTGTSKRQQSNVLSSIMAAATSVRPG